MFHDFVALRKCCETLENGQVILPFDYAYIFYFLFLHGGGLVVITESVFHYVYQYMWQTPQTPRTKMKSVQLSGAQKQKEKQEKTLDLESKTAKVSDFFTQVPHDKPISIIRSGHKYSKYHFDHFKIKIWWY